MALNGCFDFVQTAFFRVISCLSQYFSLSHAQVSPSSLDRSHNDPNAFFLPDWQCLSASGFEKLQLIRIQVKHSLNLAAFFYFMCRRDYGHKLTIGALLVWKCSIYFYYFLFSVAETVILPLNLNCFHMERKFTSNESQTLSGIILTLCHSAVHIVMLVFQVQPKMEI